MKIDAIRRQDETEHALTVQALRREVAAWKRRHADALSRLQEVQQQSSLIAGADLDNAAPVVIEPTTNSGHGEAVALAVCGDWHVFERVVASEVNGLNSFDRGTAHRSIANLARGIVRWVEIHRHGTTIRTLVLSLLGDLMTNQIHEDQLETNVGTPQEEILFLYEHVIGLIDHLLAHGRFTRIVVACTDGNHGRDTDKTRKANRVRHSHEWLLYKMLELYYAEHGKGVVQFKIADGVHLYLDVFGKVVRQHHGDTIKYQGGIGGLTIPARKAIGEWDKGRRADLDVFGHFHTRHFDAKFLSNGALIGYSPYALTIKAPFELPSQSMVLLDKKRWITADNRIFVR